ncbi:14587_t:CDS:2 [Cetraspora pellucida]|uniref:14587_t:CDS:1 n=1 Tax=Cetraspora pellucida TaxID=1433469 RepID=A0A9N9BYI1_9GLOM|nr:14587_t:CDS:2 [Cetraspora pellucida]
MHFKKHKNNSKKPSISYTASVRKKKRDEQINKKFLIYEFSEHFEYWKQNIKDMSDNESSNYKDTFI